MAQLSKSNILAHFPNFVRNECISMETTNDLRLLAIFESKFSNSRFYFSETLLTSLLYSYVSDLRILNLPIRIPLKQQPPLMIPSLKVDKLRFVVYPFWYLLVSFPWYPLCF